MENIKKAIKHFECMKSDAVAVLDSGFGKKPNESNTVYKNRKLYAELAINALEKQIPKKPILKYHKEAVTPVKYGRLIEFLCPNCGKFIVATYETDVERGGEIHNGLNDLTKMYYVEVIGNIHDNPELLKEGAE